MLFGQSADALTWKFWSRKEFIMFVFIMFVFIMFEFITFYHEIHFSICIIEKVLWKLRKYLSTCNISVNNLWWLVKQPHYCVWLVRSLPPFNIGLDRFHPYDFKQPEEHMTPVNLDATLYVWTFILSCYMSFWWLLCQAF